MIVGSQIPKVANMPTSLACSTRRHCKRIRVTLAFLLVAAIAALSQTRTNGENLNFLAEIAADIHVGGSGLDLYALDYQPSGLFPSSSSSGQRVFKLRFVFSRLQYSVNQAAGLRQGRDVLVQQRRGSCPDGPVKPIIPPVVHFPGISTRAATAGAIPHIPPITITEVKVFAQQLETKVFLAFVHEGQSVEYDLEVGVYEFS